MVLLRCVAARARGWRWVGGWRFARAGGGGWVGGGSRARVAVGGWVPRGHVLPNVFDKLQVGERPLMTLCLHSPCAAGRFGGGGVGGGSGGGPMDDLRCTKWAVSHCERRRRRGRRFISAAPTVPEHTSAGPNRSGQPSTERPAQDGLSGPPRPFRKRRFLLFRDWGSAAVSVRV